MCWHHAPVHGNMVKCCSPRPHILDFSFQLYELSTHAYSPNNLVPRIYQFLYAYSFAYVDYLFKLELVYLPKGKYCVYPGMVYRLAIVMPPPPFWMTENEFRSHFSPFQSNTQLWFFSQNRCRRPFWPIAFLAISDQYSIFVHKMAAGDHFGWPKITFDRISRHFRSIRNFFLHKMAAGGHFGWLKIAFDRISRHFRSIRKFRFHKMAAGGHFGWPKITFDRISRHFRSIRNFDFFDFFHKMAAGGHFGWPKITFWSHFSLFFRSIRNFDFFSQNGCRRPFWMTENHFQIHFSPFQINTQLFF